MTGSEDVTAIRPITSISCARCGINVSSTRELFGICQRAVRTYEGGEVDRVAFGFIGGIPIVLPSGVTPTVERLEGEDLVVETPLPVCDECWNLLDGGSWYRVLAWCSQVMGTAGVVSLIELPADMKKEDRYPVVFGFHGDGGPKEAYNRRLSPFVINTRSLESVSREHRNALVLARLPGTITTARMSTPTTLVLSSIWLATSTRPSEST